MKLRMKDYERIYKTINAILVNENADPTMACTFFSAYGSHILRNHYNMDARLAAGLCMYNLGGENNILIFGANNGERFQSTIDAFHCWVLADDLIIDFNAPAFPDLLRSQGSLFSCSPKMMQKPISSMSKSPLDLRTEGDFYFEENPIITDDRIKYVASQPAFDDLAKICNEWYRRPPKEMKRSIVIGDGKGSFSSVSLAGRSVEGAW